MRKDMFFVLWKKALAVILVHTPADITIWMTSA